MGREVSEIDGALFGHSYECQRIDALTPPVLIAGCGWLGLAVCGSTAAYSGWFEIRAGLP